MNMLLHVGVLFGALMCVVAAVWAVIDVIRAPGLRPTERAVWCVAVLLVPIVGPAVWLMLRRRREAIA